MSTRQALGEERAKEHRAGVTPIVSFQVANLIKAFFEGILARGSRVAWRRWLYAIVLAWRIVLKVSKIYKKSDALAITRLSPGAPISHCAKRLMTKGLPGILSAGRRTSIVPADTLLSSRCYGRCLADVLAARAGCVKVPGPRSKNHQARLTQLCAIFYDRKLVLRRHAPPRPVGAPIRKFLLDTLSQATPIAAHAVELLRDRVHFHQDRVVEHAAWQGEILNRLAARFGDAPDRRPIRTGAAAVGQALPLRQWTSISALCKVNDVVLCRHYKKRFSFSQTRQKGGFGSLPS
jgi:hypothetical protein